MARLTRSNVAYDLNISPHKLEMEYKDETIIYVFSSNLYKEKFLQQLDSNRLSINQSLSKRFGFEIVNDKLADLKLYTVIEKRGFLMYRGQDKVECLNTIILDGNQMISKS